jgi:hypothetical protein
MRPHPRPPALAFIVAVVLGSVAPANGCARASTAGEAATLAATPPTLMGHAVRLDASDRLLSWSTADAPYAQVAGLAWRTLETRFPPQDNGIETWLANSRFDPVTFEGVNWPHNPAGLYAMLTDSAVLWYAFSGDRAAIDLARRALDYQLDHGTTPAGWDWPHVPYASANAGDVDYRGADDAWCNHCGSGDGIGVIEPDKVGELGFAYLQMFEVTGEARFRVAAIACADALARHVRPGDRRRSPWPFRVYAETGAEREEYSANVVGALMLFDELVRLGPAGAESAGGRDGAGTGQGADQGADQGVIDRQTEAYAAARSTALAWLLRVPMTNDAWSGYFEDIESQFDPSDNPNQYPALRAARWLMAHPEADPDWRGHVAHLLAWTADVFGRDTLIERGAQWGAMVLSEQAHDMAKMGSHTARFGATAALWSEATGDRAARELAARSLNWATYTCSEDGVVAVGEDRDQGWWFSDGYGDYIRHFLVAMAAVPAWAPRRENHLLRSTSVVDRIEYAPGRIAWTTFDPESTETLRLTSRPIAVTVDGDPLKERAGQGDQGFVARPLPGGGVLLRIRHRGRGQGASPGEVVVLTAPAAARR